MNLNSEKELTMPNVNDLSESKYLKKEDVDPAVLAEITGYEKVNVEKEGKPPKWKYVLELRGISKQLPLTREGKEKPLVLNKTNGNRVAHITGTSDFDGWIGKEVVLFNDPMVEFGGDLVGGVRIRAKQEAGTQGGVTPEQKAKIDAASEAMSRDQAKVNAEAADATPTDDEPPVDLPF